MVNLLHEPNACFSARRAAIVLGTLGNDGLQPLLAVLTNQQANADLRYYLAAEIEAVQTNRMAIPALRELLKDSDPALGRWASNVLQQF